MADSDDTSAPRVLVLTLRTDENEFDACVESIQAQQGVCCDHVVFSELPNKEAHDTLYRRIMTDAKSYDYFVKLDADMVFRSPESLRSGLQLFIDNPKLDHVQFSLSDWYTSQPMMGLHIFSNRCRWSSRGESLFVDYRPEIPGHRRHVREAPAPLADHSPNPSAYQAFLFGVHRGSKVYQLDRWLVNGGESRSQWQVLGAVWAHFLKTKDRRLALALLGSEAVRDGKLRHKDYNKDGRDAIKTRFDELNNYTDDDLLNALEPLWSQSSTRKWRWRRQVLLRDLATRALEKFTGARPGPELLTND